MKVVKLRKGSNTPVKSGIHSLPLAMDQAGEISADQHGVAIVSFHVDDFRLIFDRRDFEHLASYFNRGKRQGEPVK